jgi:hypothetical protein
MRNILYIAIIALLMFGCASSKKTSRDYLADAPDWVKQSPNSPGFYHGVASATKALTQMDYHEKARQNALSELAGNISVKISSSSVLNQYEYDNQYSEFFRDNIRLSSEEYLEGYELVDSWENEEQYWVYYRLSKQKYEQVKAQRKQAAIAKSLGNYWEAKEFEGLGNVKESIRFNIKAIEDVKDFLGDDISVEVQGVDEAYGSTLLSGLTATLQNIRIIFPMDSLIIKRGKTPVTNPMIVKVVNNSGQALSGVNLKATISWAPGKNIISVSDAGGKARIEIEKAYTKKTEEYIESMIDLDKLVRKSTSDPVIRKLLQNISVPGYVLPVLIEAPVFFVKTQETNLGEQLNKPMIYPEIIQILKRDGIIVTDDREKADFEILVEAETSNGSQRSKMYFAGLDAQITLTNGPGQQLYNKSVDGISGMGDNFEEAGLDAYDALISKFKINIYPEIYERLFK